MRREGLEPTSLAAPEPKSGASANSATFAEALIFRRRLYCPVTVDHYENFPVASWLLPARLRGPVAVIYRFARSADDFADEGELPAAERLARLDSYRAELDRLVARSRGRT